MERDDPSITWPALLAHWTRLAQVSRGLPATAEGDRMRAAVPSVIALHAVTCALGEVGRLAEIDRGAAVDRAGHVVAGHAGLLRGMFRAGESGEIDGLIEDAERALAAARAGLPRRT